MAWHERVHFFSYNNRNFTMGKKHTTSEVQRDRIVNLKKRGCSERNFSVTMNCNKKPIHIAVSSFIIFVIYGHKETTSRPKLTSARYNFTMNFWFLGQLAIFLPKFTTPTMSKYSYTCSATFLHSFVMIFFCKNSWEIDKRPVFFMTPKIPIMVELLAEVRTPVLLQPIFTKNLM